MSKLNVLLVVSDKDSADRLKATCLYKGCHVLDGENPRSLFAILNEETIDIVFLENNSMNLVLLDIILSFYAIPVIMISDITGQIDDGESFKRDIFYRLLTPLNNDELEAVIDAAIKAVKKKILSQTAAASEIILPEKSIEKVNLRRRISTQISKTFESIDRSIRENDRKVVQKINKYNVNISRAEMFFKNIYRPFTKPINNVDIAMSGIVHRILR